VGAQGVVELGQPHPGSHAGEARAHVDVEDGVEPAEIEADRRLEPPAQRRDAADDARAAAERDHRRAGLGARAQDRVDLLVARRRDDHVGRVLACARPQREQVEIRLPRRAQHADPALLAHVPGADRRLERRA
jgi:hypothetical protein